jgi:hypothetical protein
LISVHPAFGQGVLDRGITTQQRGACANAESFVRKTLKQRLKLLLCGLRDHERVRVWLAKRDCRATAKVPDALQVSEEIDGPGLFPG